MKLAYLACISGLAAVPAAVFAQSSVTLFGVVDAAVATYKNESKLQSGETVSTKRTALTSGSYNASRFGFRGTEDLGGGLAAGFWLEQGFLTDTGGGLGAGGAITLNRRSTLSLSGTFGEIRLGRDYTPSVWNDVIFDPFNTNGIGTNLIFAAGSAAERGVPNVGTPTNPSYIRANNSIGYFLPPSLGGVYGQFMYAFDERTVYSPGGLTPPGVANPTALTTPDNARVGKYVGGRVGFLRGPFDAAVSYSESTVGSSYYAGSINKLKLWNIGSSYDFGWAKFFAEYSANKQSVPPTAVPTAPVNGDTPGSRGFLLGVTVPVGAGLIRASYTALKYRNLTPLRAVGDLDAPEAKQLAIGFIYNLSKRTALYTTVAYIKNEHGAALLVAGSQPFLQGAVPGRLGAAVPSSSRGVEFGLRHGF